MSILLEEGLGLIALVKLFNLDISAIILIAMACIAVVAVVVIFLKGRG